MDGEEKIGVDDASDDGNAETMLVTVEITIEVGGAPGYGQSDGPFRYDTTVYTSGLLSVTAPFELPVTPKTKVVLMGSLTFQNAGGWNTLTESRIVVRSPASRIAGVISLSNHLCTEKMRLDA